MVPWKFVHKLVALLFLVATGCLILNNHFGVTNNNQVVVLTNQNGVGASLHHAAQNDVIKMNQRAWEYMERKLDALSAKIEVLRQDPLVSGFGSGVRGEEHNMTMKTPLKKRCELYNREALKDHVTVASVWGQFLQVGVFLFL